MFKDVSSQTPEAVDKKQPLSVFEILRSENDGLFRSRLDELRVAAPVALKEIGSYARNRGKDKFSHTFDTLRILNTEGLEPEDVFIARAGMMFHDCDPAKSIADLSDWVKDRQINGVQAFRIMQQVWWHDILGVDINPYHQFTNNIFRIAPEARDRAVIVRVFKADVGSYGTGVSEAYADMDFDSLTRPLEPSRLLGVESVVATENMRRPREDEIFVHGIYDRRMGDENIESTTTGVLMNCLMAGSLKSSSFISKLEFMKARGFPGGGLSVDNGLSVFCFNKDSVNSDLGEGKYGDSDKNWVRFVYLGRDVSDMCLVRPLDTAEHDNEVGSLVNRFQADGKPIGLEMPMERAYFFVNFEGANKLVPLLKLQALKEGADPDEWVAKRVIVHKQKDFSRLARELTDGSLDVRGESARAMVEGIKYPDFWEDAEFSAVASAISEVSLPRTRCGIFSLDDFGRSVAIERVDNAISTFPWLSEQPEIRSLTERIKTDKAERDRVLSLFRGKKDVESYYFDEGSHCFLLSPENSDYYIKLAGVNSVKTYKTEEEGEGSKKKRHFELSMEDGTVLEFDLNHDPLAIPDNL